MRYKLEQVLVPDHLAVLMPNEVDSEELEALCERLPESIVLAGYLPVVPPRWKLFMSDAEAIERAESMWGPDSPQARRLREAHGID